MARHNDMSFGPGWQRQEDVKSKYFDKITPGNFLSHSQEETGRQKRHSKVQIPQIPHWNGITVEHTSRTAIQLGRA